MHSQLLSMSSKYGDKRTNVCSNAERTCVFLAIGVLSMSSKSRVKRTYVWAKAKRNCVLLAIGEQVLFLLIVINNKIECLAKDMRLEIRLLMSNVSRGISHQWEFHVPG